jgi:hypothetical protein
LCPIVRASDLRFKLFFSITRSEDIPFIRGDEAEAKTQGTFLPDYRPRQQQAACTHRPKASLRRGYREPLRSSVQAVSASGDTDNGTPLWFMQHTVQFFSHRLEVVLRGQGHTEWNDCIAQIYQQLVLSGSVDGVDCIDLPAGAATGIQDPLSESDEHSGDLGAPRSDVVRRL